jgi:glycosyltransferase involved in cell wall biosynthesis
VGGTPELIEDGVNGLLVAPGDVGTLAVALRRVVTDCALRRRLGCAARERIVRGGFSWDATAARTRDIYDSVLGD